MQGFDVHGKIAIISSAADIALATRLISTMSNDALQDFDGKAAADSVSSVLTSAEVGADPQPPTSDRWTAASYAYSRVLSSSMKKIIATRPRMAAAMKATILGGVVEEQAAVGQAKEHELELFAQFVAAAARKDKEDMLSLIMQHPQLMQLHDKDDRLALHLVCQLEPNYFFADVIEMMVEANEESPASMDKHGQTPLHILCQNTTVTREALSCLLMAMPASAVMCDKRSCLAVHYLCSNPKCNLDMLWSLGQPDTYATKNEDLHMPLQCLAMTLLSSKMETFLHLLTTYPSAAAGVDIEGRNALHWVCESELVDMKLLSAILPSSGNAPCKQDKYMDLPLHLLCQNSSISEDTMRKLIHANPDALYACTENALTALHFLSANEAISADLLAAFLAYDKHNCTASAADVFGATPLHLICMNDAICPAALRVLLLVSSDLSFSQDAHGRSPMHYLCMNRAISSELVWLFLERTQDLVREIDVDGKTPLHHLCANKSVMPVTLEILYDACPSATVVADKELRLPIQYLVDNPLSPTETTALLISGPASYRLRYDFLSAVGDSSAVSFLRNDELVYTQTNLAIDSKTSNNRVWITFLSSVTTLEHEHSVIARLGAVSQRVAARSTGHNGSSDFSMKILDDFDDAKRRVSFRQAPMKTAVAPEDHIADASVTLHYGLVTEAPEYTLEALYTEPLRDLTSTRSIIYEIGECLSFWHREALLIHGNVALECVGQFAERGLRLVQFHTSREFHERVRLSDQALNASSIPPEAARVFLANDTFEPTTSSDIWQFGCLVFQLATGKSLLATLAPWSENLAQPQLLHLIKALSDDAIQSAIAGVADESLRGLLQVMLVANPTQRWSIDRLMHIDALRALNEPTLASSTVKEELRGRLQRHADTELLTAEYQRSAKHAQDQLDFIKTEQRLLRSKFLTAKTQLRECEENSDQLRCEVAALKMQLDKVQHQKKEIQHENNALARNYQSMTQQLHTTMQMLLNLVPLAKRVYGDNADTFLSTVLARSSSSESAALSTIDIEGPVGYTSLPRPRRKSAVEVVKCQLQNSILAHGCINSWANRAPPPVLEPHELSCSSRSEDDPEDSPSAVDNDGDLDRENDSDCNVPGMWDVALDDDHAPFGKCKTKEQYQAGCFLVEAEDTDELLI